MSQALNNFYIVQPYERETDQITNAIYKYENTIDVDVWRGNAPLQLAQVVSADKAEWVGSITGDTYSAGDLVVYDPTCIIKHFEDGTKLIRDDAIICLFNEDEDAPGANRNQVVVKVERDTGLGSQNVINGFYGVVVDVSVEATWNEKSEINNVEIGDRIILVNPYRAGTEMAAGVFRKVSTASGFYVIAEVDSMACKIEDEQ